MGYLGGPKCNHISPYQREAEGDLIDVTGGDDEKKTERFEDAGLDFWRDRAACQRKPSHQKLNEAGPDPP